MLDHPEGSIVRALIYVAALQATWDQRAPDGSFGTQCQDDGLAA
jgi:hypothetical protein